MASTLEPDVKPNNPYSRSEDPAGDWLRENGRLVTIALAVVVVAIVGWLGYRTVARGNAQRAERAFFEAGLGRAGWAGGHGARHAADRHALQGDDRGARRPHFCSSSRSTSRGRWQDGIAALDRADVPDTFKAGAQLLRAAGLEGAGRPADAAKIYEQLAGGDGVVPRRRDELRASAARAYQLAGDRAAARRLWQQIVTDNASPLVDEARVRVGELAAT
jgi:hypothetical protein